MIELLKDASEALIANDADTLERLAQQARLCAGASFRLGVKDHAQLASAAEVLRRQVLAAAAQLKTRRRFGSSPGMQADPWAH